MTEDELRFWLAETYEKLRAHQETLFRTQAVALAMRQALRDLDPNFEAVYAHYYEAEQSGQSGQANAAVLALFDEIIHKLRSGGQYP